MSDAQDTPERDVLDLSLFRELGQNALVEALNSVNGAKTLVLDPSLAGPLGLLTEISLLKQHGVDKMFWLEPGPLMSNSSNVVYLCRPKIKLVKVIADQIKRNSRAGQKYVYTVFLVPRVSTLVSRVLEEEGVLGEVTLSAFNLQFLSLDDDLISLENENAFKDIWGDGDETVVFDSAQALMTFQKLYGLFPRIIGKGEYAGRLATMLARVQAQALAAPDARIRQSEKLDSLIILDRRVDMITPLLTQLTYEGLMDELIGIKNSHVELPISLLSPPTTTPASSGQPSVASTSTAPAAVLAKEKKKKHRFVASSDPLYSDLRNSNFSCVGRKLNKTARRLDEDYKAGMSKGKSVAQLRDFVGKLGGLQNEHQCLRLHTGLSEMIVPLTRTEQFNKSLEIQQNLLASYEVSTQITAIEGLIAQGADRQTVTRLLCLASIINGGIKAKTLESIKREYLQAYGYEYMHLLLKLASPSLGLLVPIPIPPSMMPSPAAAKIPFPSIRKSIRLLTDEQEDLEDPKDISYVYSGYAPLSVRLVQCVVQKGGVLNDAATNGDKVDSKAGKQANVVLPKVRAHPILGWKGFEDVLEAIPGETFDVIQNGLPGDATRPSGTSLLQQDRTSTSVVFFLGGCTYTEIAALRWVTQQNLGRRIVVATTGIISGGRLVDSLFGGERVVHPAKEAAI